MTNQCPDPLELAVIVRLPFDDPRRRHLDTCSRCRGLVKAMDLFLEPGNTSDLENLTEADSELEIRLASALPPEHGLPSRSRRRRSVLGLGLAAVLALFAVGLSIDEFLHSNDDAILETGHHQRGAQFAEGVKVSETEGGMRLAWPDNSTADAVVYIFFSHDMTELDRRVTPGILVLSVNDPLLSEASFCQALAVAQGDTVGRSEIFSLAPGRE